MSFMRWQLRRGVLEPVHSDRPGSPWWRAVNERLLRDGCEAVALSGGLAGPASSRTVDYWMSFAVRPTARAWYRAHNSSVVAAYLDHRGVAEAENAAERFFMNADRASSRGGPAAAAAFLELAANLTSDPGRRARLTIASAESKYDAGSLRQASALLDDLDVASLGDADNTSLVRPRVLSRPWNA